MGADGPQSEMDQNLPGEKGSKFLSERRVWRNMLKRCLDPSCEAWKNYGGRGVSVCAEWVGSFAKFLEDMGSIPGPGYEIDRADNDGDYTPGNCRWTTRKENSRNRRSNRMVEFQGRKMCLTEAAELAGLPRSTVQKRIDGPAKWSLEKALTTPVRRKSKKGEGKQPPPMTNATGFRGVKRRRGGFTARIVVGGKRLQSRQFSTAEEASEWYVEQQKSNARTRLPLGQEGTELER